jgi:type IV secretion system protein VirD4
MSLETRAPAPFPAPALWERNGGLYLGMTLKDRRDGHDFPLDKHDKEPPVGAESAVKSSWPLDGCMHRYIGERHVFLVAPNRSGKSRKLLMVNLLALRDWSCVAVDPKGELCAHTALARVERRGHRVAVIDPFGVMARNYPRLVAKYPDIFKNHGFNPLAGLSAQEQSFVDDVRIWAQALVKTEPDARDPYWTLAAQSMIKGVLLGLKIRHGRTANLNMLRMVLGSGAEGIAKCSEKFIAEYGEGVPALAASLREFTRHSPDDRELSGIRRTALAHTEWMDGEPMRATLARGTFDAAMMNQVPTTVYLILPPRYLESHGVWLRLMVTSLLMPLMASAEPPQVPVLFMLDECAHMGHVAALQNNYALAPGYGVKFWTVWQDLTQAQELYKTRWETMIGNAGIRQVFAPQDVTTREYFSKLSGERMKIHPTYSRSTSNGWSNNFSKGGGGFGESGGTNESWGEQRMNERVIKPHELAALDKDESVYFDRRGKVHVAVCPQPEYLVSEPLRQARRDIEG